MKTEDLIAMLSTATDAVDSRASERRYLLAVTGGTLAAVSLTAGLLRFNPLLRLEVAVPMFWVRETYCATLGVLGFMSVVRLARPGVRLGLARIGIPLVLIAIWTLGVATLVRAPPRNREALVLGHTAAVCPFLIALIAAPLFIALIWAVRGLAPTKLRQAGAACGFAAGSIGALVYTLHCPELTAPFLGIWYLLGMLIPTILGACLGPRLLRW